MKGKLEFDLEDSSDKKAFKRAVNATDAYIALHNIENLLRRMLKNTDDDIECSLLRNLQTDIYEIITEYVDMNDLE